MFIREFTLNDANDFFKASAFTEHYSEKPRSKTEAKTLIEGYIRSYNEFQENRNLCITEESANKMVGYLSFYPVGLDVLDMELWISHEHQNKGYGAEVVEQVKKMAKDKCIMCIVPTYNEASLAFLEKVGYKDLEEGKDTNLYIIQ